MRLYARTQDERRIWVVERLASNRSNRESKGTLSSTHWICCREAALANPNDILRGPVIAFVGRISRVVCLFRFVCSTASALEVALNGWKALRRSRITSVEGGDYLLWLMWFFIACYLWWPYMLSIALTRNTQKVNTLLSGLSIAPFFLQRKGSLWCNWKDSINESSKSRCSIIGSG